MEARRARPHERVAWFTTAARACGTPHNQRCCLLSLGHARMPSLKLMNQFSVREAVTNQSAKVLQASTPTIAPEGGNHIPGMDGSDHPEFPFLLHSQDVGSLDQVPIGESTIRLLADMAKNYAHSA